MTERVRLSIISEIGNGRPIHMLRPGTFTGMSGVPVTFSAEEIAGIVANFKAGRRPKPPITESHDFGRAVGRIVDLWSDDAANLYGNPKWNTAGRQLLADEVYDGFSVEVEGGPDGWTLIGGSLTNYPAVDGLAPVSLSAPVVDTKPAGGPAVDTQQEDTLMAEETPVEVVETPTAPPAVPQIDAAELARALSTANLSQDVAGRITDMVRQSVMQQFEAVRQQAETQARAEIARFQREQQIVALAQHMTTPTLQRQHALPFEAGKLASFLTGLSEAQRTEALALFEQVLTAGLVSFEEIGTGREGQDADSADAVLARYETIKAQKVAAGMDVPSAHLSAVNTVGKDAYNRAKKGGK